MLLQRFGLTWGMLLAAAGVGIAVFVALLLARRLAVRVFGPVFEYETLHLARKGHTFWLRTGFALLILGLLCVTTPTLAEPGHGYRGLKNIEPGQDFMDYNRGQLDRFAGEFSNSMLFALAVAITLISPLYFGMTISEEKEKGKLEFLLATRLDSREIILGKYAARVLNLVGVLLAAVPILALTQLWGGVDWKRILLGFTAIFAAMLGYGAIATACSTLAARTRNAVIAGYTWILLLHIPPIGVLTPIAFGLFLQDLLAPVARTSPPKDNFGEIFVIWSTFLAFYLGVTIAFLALAMRSLRKFAARAAGRRVTTAASARIEAVTHPLTLAPNPPMCGDPLIWKEQYLGRTVGGQLLGSAFWTYALIALLILTVFAVVLRIDGTHNSLALSAFVSRVVAIVLGLMLLLGVSLRLAATVSREREQQTLVGLLTLPISSWQILAAKWRGTLRRARPGLVGVGLSFAVATLLSDTTWESFVLLPILFASQLYFIGNVGLFLSVVCRSPGRAYLLLLVPLVTLVGASWTISYIVNGRGDSRVGGGIVSEYVEQFEYGALLEYVVSLVGNGLSPPQSLWRLMEGQPNAVDELNFLGFITSAVVHTVLGLLLWVFAWALFRRWGARQ